MKNTMYILLTSIAIIHVKLVACNSVVSAITLNQTDPFEDFYVTTMLRLDRKQLAKFPILEDDVFFSQLDNPMPFGFELDAFKNTQALNDEKLDGELLAQRAMDEAWEELLVAGPLIANYVSNLIVLSSKYDFPFTPSNPNHVYQYIQYPKSFRTTLVQVAHQIYNAFMNAHTNMDKIRINMEQIPRDIQTVLKLLTSASPRLIQSMLPIALNNIERISKTCADVASKTRDNFEQVTHLLQEVSATTVDSYGVSTDVLLNITALVNQSLAEKEFLNSQLQDIRNQYEAAKKALEKAREDYYVAFHAIPTNSRIWNLVAAATFGFVIGGFARPKPQPPPAGDNSAFLNAKEKAELALEELRRSEKEYDKWYSEMIGKQDKLAGTILQMSQLNMNASDYQTTIQLLTSATEEIAAIEQQWSNMTRFFSMLAMRVEATQEIVVSKFVERIQVVILDNGILDAADREFFVMEMMDTVDEIDYNAHLLYLMAKTFYDVSGQYVLNQIAGVSGLAVIQTDGERENRMQQLAQNALSTSAKVSRMVLERKEEYTRRNHARQDYYQELIKQVNLEELGSIVGK